MVGCARQTGIGTCAGRLGLGELSTAETDRTAGIGGTGQAMHIHS